MDKPDRLLLRLEELLHNQVRAHEHLASLLVQKRQSLGANQHRRLVQLLQKENQSVGLISELEKQRLELVAELTLKLVPGATEPMRLGQLAERVDEPVRGRLLVLRQQLGQLMERVTRETRIARRATEALLHHVQGLMQTIGIACTAGVYGRSGATGGQAASLSTINTTA